MTGDWPTELVDHINGNRADNAWVNLRAASKQINAQNRRKVGASNTTGFLGVSRKRSKFIAQILDARGRKLHLGCFDSAKVAHEAYLTAKRQLHEGCTL